MVVFSTSFVFDISSRYLQKKTLILRGIILEREINLDVFKSVCNLDILDYDSTDKYNEIYFNLTQGYQNIMDLLQNFALLIGKILSIFGIGTIIGIYYCDLLFMIIIFVLFNAILNFFNAKVDFKKTLRVIPSLRSLDYIRRIFYLKQYAGELRIFKISDLLINKYHKYSDNYNNTTKKFINIEFILSSLQTLLQIIMQFAIILFLATRYIKNQIKIGDFLVVFNSIIEVSSTIESLINIFPEFYKNCLYINELYNFLNPSINDVFTEYGIIHKLELINISFSFVGLIGPNGAGKSTLMKCMSSLILYNQGSISIFGKDLQKERDKALQVQSSMIEGPGLFNSLTGWQNIDLFKGLKNVSRKRMDLMIAYTKLGQQIHKKVGTYSVGMKQRLALAIALLNEPKFLMLDEPMNGLDPTGVLELRQELKNMVEKDHMTLLISSHQLNEIEKLANRVLYIDDGKIYKMEESRLQLVYRCKVDREILQLTLPGKPVRLGACLYQFSLSEEKELNDLLQILLQNAVKILEITQVQDELEDAYRRIYEVDV